jgi:hypothetical protein
MTRTRIALTMTTLGLAGLLGLTACGSGAAPTSAPAGAAALGDAVDLGDAADLAGAGDLGGEALALTAVGFETGLEIDPAPAASAPATDAAKAGKARKAGAARKLLRRNTLHGEVTLRTKKGVKTIVVQRGAVTAVTASGVTVKSTDGFVASWTFGDKLRVRKDKKAAERAAIVIGAEIGVAGAKAGDTSTAQLIAVK